MYVVTPTGPEDMKEEMALAVLVSTVVYIQNDKLLSWVILIGQNLAELFWDVRELHLLLVLKLAHVLSSPNKRSIHLNK